MQKRMGQERMAQPQQPHPGPAQYGDSTRSVHAGRVTPRPGEPYLPGPTFASIFGLDAKAGPIPGVDAYGRPDSPTRRRLEEAIGALEGGHSLVFATGMAAITSMVLSLVTGGDTILVPADGYYAFRAWATSTLPGLGIPVLTAPTAGPCPDLTGVRLAVIETPANPGLSVCDIGEWAQRSRAAGALLVCDNTTATPLGQRPLDLGADLVVASGTKALSGHSDLLLGYVAAREARQLAPIQAWRNSTGAIPGDFEAWLAHRSLATLDLRLRQQTANAAAVATLLAAHPSVRSVRWPGLPDDPAHALASRQMTRMPGVVTFELASADDVTRLLDACHLISAATSFGGLHTTADRRAQWGDDAPPGLIRLSLGIEDSADLVTDLSRGLDALA
jgi:cystathionine gamma-lyase